MACQAFVAFVACQALAAQHHLFAHYYLKNLLNKGVRFLHPIQ